MKICLRLTLLAIGVWSVACSNGGEDGGKTTVHRKRRNTEEGPKKERPSYETVVGLGLLENDTPSVYPCARLDPPPEMGAIDSTAAAVDGDSREWQDVKVATEDGIGEHSVFDLTRVRIAEFDKIRPMLSGFASLAELKREGRNDDVALVLEFGQAVQAAAGLELTKARTYKIIGSQILEEEGGVWRALPNDIATAIQGADGFEWQIERRQLDAVINQGAWWSKWLLVDAENDAEIFDESNLILFPSEDPLRRKEFSIRRCDSENHQVVPLVFLQMHDGSINSKSAEVVFDTVRMTYEHIQKLIGYKPLKAIQWPVVVSRKIRFNHTIWSSDNYQRSFYQGIYIPLTPKLEGVLAKGEYQQIYKDVFIYVASAMLASAKTDEHELITTLAHSLYLKSLRENFGLVSWLKDMRWPTKLFVDSDDALQPVSLPTRIAREKEPFPSEEEHAAYIEMTVSKTAAFATWLSELMKESHVGTAWFQQGVGFYDALLVLDPAYAQSLPKLWSGWMRDENYHADFLPHRLADEDGDGLPHYFEDDAGTDPESADSDADGWSDFAEMSKSKDPLDAQSRPSQLMADGLIGDWQQLLPTRLQLHRASVPNSSCSKQSHLSVYGALITPQGLLVSAKPKEPWDKTSNIAWEAHVRAGMDEHSVFLRSNNGSLAYTIYSLADMLSIGTIQNGFVSGVQAVEWFLPLRFLESITARSLSAVSVQIMSTLEDKDRTVCDSTILFRPLRKSE